MTLNGQPLPFLPIYHDDDISDNPFHPGADASPGVFVRFAPTKAILEAKFQRQAFIQRVIERILGKDSRFHPDSSDSAVYLDDSPDATRIPTLDEAFKLLKQHPDSHLYVELKTMKPEEPEDLLGLEEKVLRMIKAHVAGLPFLRLGIYETWLALSQH